LKCKVIEAAVNEDENNFFSQQFEVKFSKSLKEKEVLENYLNY
jgi:hypothetical protein